MARPRPRRTRLALVALLACLALLASACGDDDEPEAGDDTTETDGDEVTGTVNISGSSTVEPISVAVADKFEEVAPDAVVNVDGPGTGDGFELFCNGETEISDASRPIAEDEVAACEESGVEFIEIKIAYDGLSVLANPENPLDCLTFADLYALVGPESQGFDNWQDAQALATELGSDTQFPALPLEVTAPGEESGTYDSFVELVIEEFNEDRGAEAQTRPDYSSQSDDNAIIAGIEGSEGSLGWVGLAFAEAAGDAVKEMEVDGGDGCVGPSAETVSDGSYPISRSLFIYVNAEAAESNAAVAAYVDFYLGDDGISSAEEVGYVALPDDELQASIDVWEGRETGTREG